MDPLNLPQQNMSGTSGGGELSLYQYFIGSPLFAKFVDFEGSDRKVFLTQYVSLPSSLKNYLASTETATSIISTGLNYNLDDGQVSKLAEAIRELIIGKIFIKDFPITISSRLGIDDIKAGEIVNKIISQSFGPIIEDVKRIQRGKFPDKVMAMQKESQPTGLTRPGVSEARPKWTAQPAPQTTTQQPPIRPPAPPMQPIRSLDSIQGKQAQGKPIDFSQVKQAQNQPSSALPPPPRPPLQSPPPKTELPKPPIPNEIRPQGQQFKMPDLGPFDSAQGRQPIPKEGQSSLPQSQKSLEEELEKVANIIDLRAKQGE